MHKDARFEELHQQFEPMVYHAMRKLGIYSFIKLDVLPCGKPPCDLIKTKGNLNLMHILI